MTPSQWLKSKGGKKMRLIVKLGTAYNDYFEVDEKWEEETESLQDARTTLEKDFNIYNIYQSGDKIIAYVY